MKAKIQHIDVDYLETTTWEEVYSAIRGRFSLSVHLVSVDESLEQIARWLADDVTFELVPVPKWKDK